MNKPKHFSNRKIDETIYSVTRAHGDGCGYPCVCRRCKSCEGRKCDFRSCSGKGTENSLPYATILIVETGQGTVSNEDGEFRFKKVPAGKYTLRVQLLGYETQEKKVTVSNDFTVDVHF